MIPATVDEFTTSPAERLLFRELNTQLGDDYLVLHAVHWVAADGGRLHDGEADFVVAHPNLGVLIIEVKGGAIRRDGPTDTWYSTDWGGTEHELRQNPFRQAERSMYSLKQKLESTPATRSFRYPHSRTVAFPDVVVGDDLAGIDIARDMIIDSSNIFLLAKSIRSAMAQSPGPGPGRDGLQALLELIRPSFAVETQGLAARIKSDEAEFIRLTEQQLRLLDMLAGHRRIAIRGVAGSGKTLMAREHARRLGEAGKRVLFTCFNKALANAMADELSEYPAITVRSYHRLAEEWANAAGIPLPAEAGRDLAQYFEEVLPQAFADAISVLDTRFDAIVVDEGQDFADVWWVTLEALMADPEHGFLAVFYDDNQRIYRSETSYPIPEPHFALTRNCRCTQRIHARASHYARHGGTSDCDGPTGAEIEFVPAGGGATLDALRTTIHRLMSVEGIPVSEMIVLTPRSKATSALTEGSRLGNLALTWDAAARNGIRCSTVHAFKGLEESVVILAEWDRAHATTRDALLHVALTRARSHVVVIGELPPPTQDMER